MSADSDSRRQAAPPHSKSSEENVIGSLMLDSIAWTAAQELQPDDFYVQPLRVIFATIADLAGAGKPFDVGCVIAQLEREGMLDAAGGEPHVRALARDTVTAANVAQYVGHVREWSEVRRLLSLGSLIPHLVEDGAASAQIAEQVTAVLSRQRTKARQVTPIELSSFLGRKLPTPARVAGPLRAGSLGMVHAKAGHGKTWFMLALSVGVSHAVDTLGFEIRDARPVLYIDGEMLATEMQQRLAELVRPIHETIDHPWQPFHLVTPDLQEGGIPKIDTPEGQAAVLRLVDELTPGLLCLDNLSCLTNPEDDNRGESWTMVQELLLALRRRTVAVLIGHHSGKGGDQRGTSRRTDILDLVLKLTATTGPESDGRTRITVEFEKARGLTAQQRDPFSAVLEPHPAGGLAWSRAQAPQPMGERIREMLRDGMSPREVAAELQTASSFCYRIRKEMIQVGDIPTKSPRRQPVSPVPSLRGGRGDNTRASPGKKRGDKQGTQGTEPGAKGWEQRADLK
jgi:hypothetical protein